MKQAGVMLIIKDGLVLGISRRNDRTKFGLPGGKFDPERKPLPDKTTKDTAIFESLEETSVVVNDCVLIYHRVEPADSPTGTDFHSYCYYATDWTGEPQDSEEGEVRWLTVEEITNSKAAFGAYNRQTINVFKQMFPNVFLQGE
jgi:ADP-ribose pyrophosphatase YjhB (NUDIX family)